MQELEGIELTEMGIGPEQQFLMTTPFFDAMSEPAKQRLLMSMIAGTFKQGQRFIEQGGEGDSLYIIQEGVCNVSLEKDGIVHPIAALGPGEIVGEMAILTGEHRNTKRGSSN